MTAEDMTCRELADLLTDYFELALAEGERQRLERHLQTCIDCRTYLDQMHRTIELVGTLRDPAVAEPARAQLLEIFRAWKATA